MKQLDSTDLPLAGIKVIEFCSVAAGPFCGMLLADMGAEVIKIEPPEGDALRQWPPITGGFSENFASLNRNKQSIVLNLKDQQDLELAGRLVLEADVLIENNRPGVMERLGLGYSRFSVEHPSLVYCSISAYGQTGPRAAEGGFDLTIQAAAGVMSVTGETDGAPVKCGVPVSDFASGLYAAFSISSALMRVRSGGVGAHIDIPMFGCTLGIGALQTSQYFGTQASPGKMGSAHPRNAPYRAFQAADGYFVIAAGNQKLWFAVCQAVGMEALFNDPRFLTTSDRAANQDVLKEILEERFVLDTVDYWIDTFGQAGVPHARINDFEAALNDVQVKHMDWVQSIELPGGINAQTFASPISFGGAGFPIRMNPPALGEHTEMIRARFAEQQRA
ncbi:MAG TPA: CoA transferase [Eoetvoesiella sp.]